MRAGAEGQAATADGSGVNLRLRITPRSGKNAIVGISGGAVLVRLAAPPVEGAANKALVEFLASAFGVRRSQVRLVRGETSRIKIVHIDGLSVAKAMSLMGERGNEFSQ